MSWWQEYWDPQINYLLLIVICMLEDCSYYHAFLYPCTNLSTHPTLDIILSGLFISETVKWVEIAKNLDTLIKGYIFDVTW